jgi:HEAT repeat protein
MSSSQLAERRAAAAAVVQTVSHEPLAPLALARMLELMTGERDAVVWQYAMQATLADDREQAVELAYMAIGHDSPDVRRRACEYLRAHPASRHAAALTPALNDTSGEVVIAAVRALGAADTLDDHKPLTQLLLSHDKHLRLEAATSLARLRDPAGAASLERLAHEVDADLRRRAAVTMGELRDPVYVPTLVPLLRDRPEIQRAALVSLQQIVGRDVAKSAEGATISPDEQARRWEQWYRTTQAESEK